MPNSEWSAMFTGSVENLDQRGKEAGRQLDRIISNKNVDNDVIQLLHSLHFNSRFQLILIKRLLIELDDMADDVKRLKAKK